MEDKLNKYIKIDLIIILVIFVSLLGRIVKEEQEVKRVVTYVEFLDMVDKGEINEVRLSKSDSFIYFNDVFGDKYKSDNPREDSFKSDLLKKGVKVDEVSDLLVGGSPILTMFLEWASFILFICLLCKFFLKFYGSLYSNIGGSNKVQTIDLGNSKLKFKDVGGYSETKEDIKYLVDILKDPKKYSSMGAKLPKGLVLYGPPGNGKTFIIKALAGEAGVPIFSLSGSDFVEVFVGVGAKRVRDLFKEAKKKAPCIVFIDELDAIGGSRGALNTNSENIQTINALLSEIDGFEGSEGILVIGATNRLEDLDSALIRPGRFDKHIAVGLPEYKDRLEVLDIYLGNKKLSEDVDREYIAKITIGFSCSGLATLVNESAIIAVNNGHDVIHLSDIDEAYYKMLTSGNRKKKEIGRAHV